MKTTPNSKRPSEPMSRDERRNIISMKKVKQRRRRKIISYTVLLLLLIGIGTSLSLTVFFHIEKVEVTNSAKYDSESIIAASGLKLQDNMFLTNMKQAALNIETNLPYVERAKIKRHLSGKITVELVETTADMAFLKDAGYLLVSGKGKCLEYAEIIPESVALVEGAEISSYEIGQIITLSDLLAADETTVLSDGKNQLENLIKANESANTYLSGDITGLDISNINNLMMVYQGRILLKCGDVEKIDATLKFAKAIIERLDEENPNYIGTIDLTIENVANYNEGEFDTTTQPVTQPTTQPVSQTNPQAAESTEPEKTTLGTAN